MYIDPSKKHINTSFFSELSKARKDIKNELLKYSSYFKLIAFLLTLNALFLGINDTSVHILRIQALLLFILITVITFVLISSIKIYYQEKNTEIYYSFGLIIQFITGLFLYNLFYYFFSSFNQEIVYYLKFLGIPLILLFTNILSLYFLKFIKKKKNVNGSQLEYFFIITLSFNIITKYTISNYDFFETIFRLIRLEFSNIYTLYLFFLTLLSELRPIDERSNKNALIETTILILFILLPPLFNFLLTFFI